LADTSWQPLIVTIRKFARTIIPVQLIKFMKKTLFIFLAILPGSILFAQDNSVNIPGTHLNIIPPNGYKPTNKFKGFEKNNDIFIKVYDPYNSDFTKYARTFTREFLESEGSEVQDYKKLNISGFSAKYASIENNRGGKSYFLVFGDSSFSVMVMAASPAKDSDEQQLKAALLSVTYKKDIKVDPLAGAFFSMVDTNSDYRFAKNKSDYYIYSYKGVVKNSYPDESLVSVLPFTSEYSVGDETIAKAISTSYEQYDITDAKIKKSGEVTIGGLKGIETELNAKMDSRKVVLYQLTLVNGKKALVVLGIATSDYDKNMEEFRNLASTIKFK